MVLSICEQWPVHKASSKLNRRHDEEYLRSLGVIHASETLQSRINAGKPGDTIYVSGGKYQNKVTYG